MARGSTRVPTSRDKAKDYPAEFYTPAALLQYDVMTEREMRAEYSRLRSIARKRLEAMGRSEFRESEIYKRNVGAFPVTPSIESKRDLAYALSDVYRFVNAKRGSVSGLRKVRAQTIETMHKHGLTFINKSNIDVYGKLMETLRNMNLARIYSSEQVAEYAFLGVELMQMSSEELASALGNNLEDFNAFRDAALEGAKPAQARAYRRALRGAGLEM